MAGLFAVIGFIALIMGLWPATIVCWIIALGLDKPDNPEIGV